MSVSHGNAQLASTIKYFKLEKTKTGLFLLYFIEFVFNFFVSVVYICHAVCGFYRVSVNKD